jgi:hypothetical protein
LTNKVNWSMKWFRFAGIIILWSCCRYNIRKFNTLLWNQMPFV